MMMFCGESDGKLTLVEDAKLIRSSHDGLVNLELAEKRVQVEPRCQEAPVVIAHSRRWPARPVPFQYQELGFFPFQELFNSRNLQVGLQLEANSRRSTTSSLPRRSPQTREKISCIHSRMHLKASLF